jgi:hypothetical protein
MSGIHTVDEKETWGTENGQFFVQDVNGTKQFNSVQCKHCGMHWQTVPGSGRIRGYCTNCHGLVCGSSACVHECVPFEAQLEIQEGNKKTIDRYRNCPETLANLLPHLFYNPINLPFLIR